VRVITTVSLVALIGFAIPTADIAGQANVAPANTLSDARLMSAIAKLHPRATVRAYSDGVLMEGKVTQTQRDTLWLSSRSGLATGLPIQNIDSLWTGHHSAGKGALIGAVVGAAAVGGLMLAYAGSCGSDCPDTATPYVVAGVVVGGGGGGLLGAVIGAIVRHWERRYP
jgi:hypothetical protein